MASLFRFFGFAILVILALIIWAFFDYGKNRRKADSYIKGRLGITGSGYVMTRFVNMARILQRDPDRFTAVFFREGHHLEIPEFLPELVIDIPPDGVLLADPDRGHSHIFIERGKKLFHLEIKDFAPGSITFVRKGTGSVKFGEKEIPSSNRDWFLADRKRGRTLSQPLREATSQPGEGFYLYEGFAPTEGFLLDEEGGVLLLDRERYTYGFRENSRETLRVYSPEDTVSVKVDEDDHDYLIFEVRDKLNPVFSFEFNDPGEAAYWKEWFEKAAREKKETGGRVRSVFLKLPPLMLPLRTL
jgi:hypothetical protein